MRKHLAMFSALALSIACAPAAVAADLPAKLGPRAPTMASDPWSGFYVGGTAGYGFGNENTNLTPNAIAFGLGAGDPTFGPLPSGPRMAGFVGGGEIGYNWRSANMLAGLEADLSYSLLSASNSATGAFFIGGIFNSSIEAKLHWFGTVRGRLGFLATNDLLVYGTGGLAYGDAKTTVTGSNLNPGQLCPNNNCYSGSSGTSVGWTAGGGVEYAFMPKWTIKVEYLYLDFGNHSFVMNEVFNAGAAVTASTRQTVNDIRLGVNYHF